MENIMMDFVPLEAKLWANWLQSSWRKLWKSFFLSEGRSCVVRVGLVFISFPSRSDRSKRWSRFDQLQEQKTFLSCCMGPWPFYHNNLCHGSKETRRKYRRYSGMLCVRRLVTQRKNICCMSRFEFSCDYRVVRLTLPRHVCCIAVSKISSHLTLKKVWKWSIIVNDAPLKYFALLLPLHPVVASVPL